MKINLIYPFKVFPTTGRDELESNEIDRLYDEGNDNDGASDWKSMRDVEKENRAIFAPSYDETRIDMIMPIRTRKIFSNF